MDIQEKGGVIKALKKNPTIRISASMLGHIGVVSNEDVLMWPQILLQEEHA